MKRAQNYATENHGRYIASAELADLRGVSAVPASFRAAALLSAAKRDFIWWLQGLSLTEGGFRRVARELLEMFPERIGTAAMHKARIKPGKIKIYPASLEACTRREFLRSFGEGDEVESEKASGDTLIQRCRHLALTYRDRKKETWQPPIPLSELSIEQFLIELCINPKATFSLSENDAAATELETELAIEANPELSNHDSQIAELIYFRDIIGALVEYRARAEKAVRENFYLTEIGRTIWKTLDFGLSTRGMVLVYGREGRGKTEAVKAWSQVHGGQTRFASLKGITTKTAMFREVSRALGITQSYNSAGWEMQARIEDVLKRSKIMLVIDEAHFLFNQSQRTKSRPELIDWLNTAVSNCQIPLGLCTTPQFMDIRDLQNTQPIALRTFAIESAQYASSVHSRSVLQPYIIMCLTDQVSVVRGMAIATLLEFGDKTSVTNFDSLLKDPDENVAKAAKNAKLVILKKQPLK